MVEDLRIRMKFKPKRIFQMRVAGLAFRDGHVLVHRATHEKFWTFPGGRAEMGEQSQDTLAREMVEELGAEVSVGRLLWVVENFFHYEGKDWHELGFYYLMELPDSFPFDEEAIVHRVQDGKNPLEFRWVKATTEALTALDIPPYFIAAEIENLPASTRHVVWKDGNLDDK
ncbi:NUDIX hydrolase [Agrobacterium larrymoorei]|uniref:NUDIX domain-containing protein n=1 Tax=Agrobacterium larrymoorei TaxID=160699 RepID=A0A4D7DKJ3_9HYPH|nr:NUDIX hydrolase [Agrobacterium larrymoorei]QCI97065.1 NUDIX domain-containing protein [Agrobacterium larrymoorei]QYA07505.1 NUDIX hydrolase [Agrobacterium larrymoorei]